MYYEDAKRPRKVFGVCPRAQLPFGMIPLSFVCVFVVFIVKFHGFRSFRRILVSCLFFLTLFGMSGDEIEINLGSLDAPDRFRPTYELWTIRRESWLPPFPLASRYERDRTGQGRSED